MGHRQEPKATLYCSNSIGVRQRKGVHRALLQDGSPQGCRCHGLRAGVGQTAAAAAVARGLLVHARRLARLVPRVKPTVPRALGTQVERLEHAPAAVTAVTRGFFVHVGRRAWLPPGVEVSFSTTNWASLLLDGSWLWNWWLRDNDDRGLHGGSKMSLLRQVPATSTAVVGKARRPEVEE